MLSNRRMAVCAAWLRVGSFVDAVYATSVLRCCYHRECCGGFGVRLSLAHLHFVKVKSFCQCQFSAYGVAVGWHVCFCSTGYPRSQQYNASHACSTPFYFVEHEAVSQSNFSLHTLLVVWGAFRVGWVGVGWGDKEQRAHATTRPIYPTREPTRHE